jgi:hypothetical protein
MSAPWLSVHGYGAHLHGRHAEQRRAQNVSSLLLKGPSCNDVHSIVLSDCGLIDQALKETEIDMKRVIVAGALLALSSTGALAEDNDRGFYAGAGIGTFDFSQDVDGLDEVDDALDDFDFDDDDNAWKIFAGYRFMKYLSVELDYVDFGRVRDSFEADGSSGDYSLEFSGLAPYVVGTLPLGPVELSAKVGYLFYDVDVSIDLDANDLDADSSDSAEDFVYGVGLGATLFERVALKVEYEEIDTPGSSDASAFWLSGAWRF